MKNLLFHALKDNGSHRQRKDVYRIRRCVRPSDDAAHPIIVKPGVLTALENESSETQFVASGTAVHDVILGKPVAFYTAITSADTAVVTVVFTVVREFNESSGVNPVAIIFLSLATGLLKEKGRELRCLFGNQLNPFVLF